MVGPCPESGGGGVGRACSLPIDHSQSVCCEPRSGSVSGPGDLKEIVDENNFLQT